MPLHTVCCKFSVICYSLESITLESKMMPESRYFAPPAFSLTMNQYENNLDFFHQRQHVIKVEPEVSSRRPTSETTVGHLDLLPTLCSINNTYNFL